MATFSQNQVKDLIVGSAIASETTSKTFLDTASNLEVQVLNVSGSAVPSAGQSFYVVNKHSDGSVKKSDVIQPDKIKQIAVVDQKTAVKKKVTIAIPAISNFATGDILQINIVLDNWGSRSFEDQYLKFASYKVQAGDTATDIAEGLVASLVRNFSREEPKTGATETIYPAVVSTQYNATLATAKTAAFGLIAANTVEEGDKVRVYDGTTEDKIWVLTDDAGANFAAAYTEVGNTASLSTTVQANPLFTFSAVGTVNGGANVVIEEKVQQYVTGKKQGLPLEFNVTNDFDGVQTVTQRVVNPGSGRNIRDLEYFCKGNVGDGYRGMGYPHNFEPVYDSDLASTYYVTQIDFWAEGDGVQVQKSNRELVVAISDKTAANAFLVLLETATGLSLASFA